MVEPLHDMRDGVQNDPASKAVDKNRLAWRCRRGMLELDLLLQGFLDKGYDNVEERHRRAFVELLDYPDQLLLEFLLARMTPTDPLHADVVAEIRRAAHA